MMQSIGRASPILLILTTVNLATGEPEVLCGTKRINPFEEICCGEKIHDRFKNSKEMACCTHSVSVELYPKYEKVCCGEQLVHVNHENPQKCCNKELIDSNTYDCCGNQEFGVKLARSGPFKECCIDYKTKQIGLYDYKDRNDCCGSLQYHKDNEECIPHANETYSVQAVSNMRPCGKTEYDPADSLCCHSTGKVIPKPKESSRLNSILKRSDWVCWNEEPVDRNKYYFDDKASRVIPIGSQLCGNEIYNPQKPELKCCGDNLLVLEGDHKNITCCGNQLLDLNDMSQHCCDHKIIPFSIHVKGCCNGVSFDKGHDRECCAMTLINKSSHICCMTQSSHSTVLKKQHPSHTNCCKSRETGEIQTYNKYDKVCERGDVLDKVHEEPTSPPTSLPRPQQGPSVVRGLTSACPFCSPSVNKAACSKINVFRFFLYDEKWTDSSTAFNGVILLPFELKNGDAINGEKIKIRTHNLCKCFKMKRNFYLFTNRKIKSLKRNRYNLRFTANDVFIAEDDQTLAECLILQQTYAGR